ncbi:hypothetical protein [Citrobacter pasteurii]|nr:hypothetical protein HMPREF1570_1260 [Klebsiella oxytoca KA-2]KAF0681163.1 hypothetical protein Y59_06340 [Enterobacter hormaechei]CEJ63572.1 hypothetical protein [Citrobacter pasteurii]
MNEFEFFDLKIIKRCKRFGLIVSVVGLFLQINKSREFILLKQIFL